MALYFFTATLVVSVSFLFLRKIFGTRVALGMAAPSLALGYLFPAALMHFGLTKSLALYAAAIPIAGGILFFFMPRPAAETAERVDKTTGKHERRVEVLQFERSAPGLCPAPAAAAPDAEAGELPAPKAAEPPPATRGDAGTHTTAPEVTPAATGDPSAPVTGTTVPEELAEVPAGENLQVAQPKTGGEGAAGQEAAGPSPEELVRHAGHRVKPEDWLEAVRLFNAALASSCDRDLQGLIVAELSTVYQQLGRYAMAADLIEAFLEAHSHIPAASASALREKMVFNRYLHHALEKAGTPGLRYSVVPDLIKKRAYLEATLSKF